jgi:hypothetical protein
VVQKDFFWLFNAPKNLEFWLFKNLNRQILIKKSSGPHNMAKAMNHLGAAVATGGGMPELKAAFLDAIYTIFNSFDPKNAQLESFTILQNWFNELGDPFPQLLFQCLKMPFDAVQIAALHVLLALTKHEWGPAKFLQIDGFAFVNFWNLCNLHPQKNFFLKF